MANILRYCCNCCLNHLSDLSPPVLPFPRAGRQHYRLYTINSIPSLKVLDYVKISKSEREKAERLAKSAAGAALEADVQGEQSTNGLSSKTFVPGEGLSAQTSFKTSFTAEEKAQIRELVANASSAAEIEEIELSVQRGILPPQIQQQQEAKRKRSNPEDSSSNKKSRVEEPS